MRRKRFLILVSILTVIFASCVENDSDTNVSNSSLEMSYLKEYSEKSERLLELYRNHVISSDSFDNGMINNIMDVFSVSKEQLSDLGTIEAGKYSQMKKTPVAPPTPDNEYDPLKDPYVVKIKNDIEKALDEIRKNSSNTYSTLLTNAVYNHIVYWTNNEIINDANMSDDEKLALLAIKINLDISDIEMEFDIIATEYPGTPGVKPSPKKNPKKGLTAEQARNYDLCVERYNRDLEYCTVLTGNAAVLGILTTGESAAGGPGLFLFAAGTTLYTVYMTDKLCRSQAKTSVNRCLEDRKVPRRFK